MPMMPPAERTMADKQVVRMYEQDLPDYMTCACPHCTRHRQQLLADWHKRYSSWELVVPLDGAVYVEARLRPYVGRPW